MKLDVFFVDAFSSELFSGNPAAVIFSDLNDDVLMQKIAAENNLSETAFINTESDVNHIRWFSPTTEVNLCGHATLASAFIYFNYIDTSKTEISFQSESGVLKVTNALDKYELDFPKDNFKQVDQIQAVFAATGLKPIETYIGDINMLAIYENEEQIKAIEPDFENLAKLEGQGLIISFSNSKTLLECHPKEITIESKNTDPHTIRQLMTSKIRSQKVSPLRKLEIHKDRFICCLNTNSSDSNSRSDNHHHKCQM